MKILFLSRWYPFPADNGIKIRILNLLRAISREHRVTLLSFHDPHRQPSTPNTENAEIEKVHVVPWRDFDPGSLRGYKGLLARQPRSLVDVHSSEMERLIRHEAASRHDLVIASELPMAAYYRCFRHLPSLFEDPELGVIHQRYHDAASFGSRVRHGLTWIKYQHFMRHLLPSFRYCTVASEQEKTLLAQAVPEYHAVEVIPNTVDLGSYSSYHTEPKVRSLIFCGSLRFSPNLEAARWFLEYVFPLVLRRFPDLHLTVTGDHGDLLPGDFPGLRLAGQVDDVRPLITSAWASLAPIRSGSGTRVKILEAMALKTPVIATSKGAEGLSVRHGQHILIADQPNDFADAVIAVLADPELRRHLAEQAYALVQNEYDSSVVGPRFKRLVEQVALQ